MTTAGLQRSRITTALGRWAREIDDHRWMAVRALIVGWIALFVVRSIVIWLVNLDTWLFVRGLIDVRSWWPDSSNPVPHLVIGAAGHAAMGWAVGYFHREHRRAIALLLVGVAPPRPSAFHSRRHDVRQEWGLLAHCGYGSCFPAITNCRRGDLGCANGTG